MVMGVSCGRRWPDTRALVFRNRLWLKCVGSMRLMSSILRYFALLMLLVGCAIAVCAGQKPNAGALKVVVKEARDLSVAGASCSLSKVPGQTPIAAATSDEQGSARFTNILPGRYTLTVTREGFEPFLKSDVSVGEKLENEIVVVLAVATVREKVTVTAPGEAATSVEAGSTIPAGDIEREELRAFPVAA